MNALHAEGVPYVRIGDQRFQRCAIKTLDTQGSIPLAPGYGECPILESPSPACATTSEGQAFSL